MKQKELINQPTEQLIKTRQGLRLQLMQSYSKMEHSKVKPQMRKQIKKNIAQINTELTRRGFNTKYI